jgi:hypothetical protein
MYPIEGEGFVKIIGQILMTALNGLVLFVLVFAVGGTDEAYFDAGEAFPFSQGNAAGDVRAAIMQQLLDFQDGYTRRDPSQADAFAKRLFSAEDIVILGTMPDEIFIGREQATQLVESDWRYWGDCRFLMENAQISASDQVAWFSTIGTVDMDGLHIVLPLRLSGVLVEEGGVWMFQQLQFQFDLQLGFLNLVIALLLVWLIVNILLLLFHLFRALRGTVPADNANRYLV